MVEITNRKEFDEEIKKAEEEMAEKKDSKKPLYLGVIAFGIIIGLLIVVTIENQSMVDKYNDLVYDYKTNCVNLDLFDQNSTQTNVEFIDDNTTIEINQTNETNSTS